MKKLTIYSLLLVGLLYWLSPAYAHNQVVIIPLGGSSQSSSDTIVGSWGKGYYPSGIEFSAEPESISITFYPNGYYIHYETGQASEPCDKGGGVEYGTYTYNAESKQISITPIFDNNGCVGFAEDGTGGTFSIDINGDLLEFVGENLWLERVQDINSPIVSGWGTGHYAAEPEYMSLTFYPNGYYIHYETDQASEPCDNGGGVEYGTYTFNAATQQITVVPIVDTNGCFGLADDGVGRTHTVTINGDLLQIAGEPTWFDRVQ